MGRLRAANETRSPWGRVEELKNYGRPSSNLTWFADIQASIVIFRPFLVVQIFWDQPIRIEQNRAVQPCILCPMCAVKGTGEVDISNPIRS